MKVSSAYLNDYNSFASLLHLFIALDKTTWEQLLIWLDDNVTQHVTYDVPVTLRSITTLWKLFIIIIIFVQYVNSITLCSKNLPPIVRISVSVQRLRLSFCKHLWETMSYANSVYALLCIIYVKDRIAYDLIILMIIKK